MLIKIKNAQISGKETVLIPHSKFKMEIARVLEKNSFVKNIERHGKKNKKKIEITLKYNKDNKPAIEDLRRVSKQSGRIYRKTRGLKRGRNSYGIAILSTPLGVLSDKEAKKEGVGGEVICEIW